MTKRNNLASLNAAVLTMILVASFTFASTAYGLQTDDDPFRGRPVIDSGNPFAVDTDSSVGEDPFANGNPEPVKREAKVRRFPTSTSAERTAKIHDALQKEAKADYFEARFGDVLAELSSIYQIPAILSDSVINNGLDEDTLITLRLQNVSLNSCLKIMLDQHKCTAIVKDEVLMIVDIDEANDYYFTRTYDCRDLVAMIPSDRMATEEVAFQKLIAIVSSASSQSKGGPQSVHEIGGRLIVRENTNGHERVAEMLETLRVEFKPVTMEDEEAAADKAEAPVDRP